MPTAMPRLRARLRPLARVVPTLVLLVATASAAAAQTRAASATDSADAVSTVTRFHEALARGDSAAAIALLDPAATILESGAVETVAEYRAHHLESDIAYARAVPSKRAPVRVWVQGDLAWTVSSSETRGEFRGRPVNSAGAELMVLARMPQGWRIVAIHWSSRRRTT
jgi:ketosteroid isomerase-like protein